MADTTRDLATWYPVVPAQGEMPDAVRHILDMGVVISAPASERADETRAVDAFHCYITSISGSSCTVEVSGELSGASVQELRVYIGSRDARPPVGTGYIILDQAVSYAGRLQVHPDCVIVRQEPPSLSLYKRTDVMSTDGALDDSGHRIDGMVGDYVLHSVNSLSFRDGHNVDVSMSDGTVVLSGAPDAGLGVYTEPPYVDVATYKKEAGKGLRSINGVSGNVGLSGGPTVNVSVSTDSVTMLPIVSSDGIDDIS